MARVPGKRLGLNGNHKIDSKCNRNPSGICGEQEPPKGESPKWRAPGSHGDEIKETGGLGGSALGDQIRVQSYLTACILCRFRFSNMPSKPTSSWYLAMDRNSTASPHPNFPSTNLYPSTLLPTRPSAVPWLLCPTAFHSSAPHPRPQQGLPPGSRGWQNPWPGPGARWLLPGVRSDWEKPQAPIISGPFFFFFF